LVAAGGYSVGGDLGDVGLGIAKLGEDFPGMLPEAGGRRKLLPEVAEMRMPASNPDMLGSSF
jgi:hypothetical protein